MFTKIMIFSMCLYSVGQIKYESPSASRKFYMKYAPTKLKVCQQVGLRAVSKGVSPVEAIAVSFVETRHNNKLKGSAGEVGALQALPKYWSKKSDKDYIDAGLRAWKYYRNLSTSVQETAGKYNGAGTSSLYARKVQKHVNKLNRLVSIKRIF